MKKKSKLKSAWHVIMQCSIDIRVDHISAYAARSAYFFMLSLLPAMFLILMLLNFTPVEETAFLNIIREIFPDTISPLIVRIVREVLNSRTTAVSLTTIVTIFSAGKGIMALSDGLNCVHDIPETRNYVFLRIRAGLYTIFFLAAVVSLLVLKVFGEIWSNFLSERFPFYQRNLSYLMYLQKWISVPIILIFALLIFKTLPNKVIHFRREIPGAIFCWIGWTFLSFIFSFYLKVFTDFTSIYGSLSTIILIMLWLYFLMYILLLGAELNVWFRRYRIIEKIPFIGPRYAKSEESYVQKVRLHDMKVMDSQKKKINAIYASDEVMDGAEQDDTEKN